MRTPVRVLVLCLVLLVSAPAARAQNWSFDARNIGLGGVGDVSNVAVNMVDEQRPYRAIVLPFGLVFQVLPNISEFNPTEDDFDLVRAIEYAASPLHYIIDRNTTDTGQQFVNDIRNAELNRDLNTYRGFVPANDVFAEGLASPSYGGTIKFRNGGSGGAFQGIYVGAGPYLSMQTTALIDPALTALLGSPTPVVARNTSFYLSNDTISQTALAITGGYRGRFSWGSAIGAGRAVDGFYLGANYHFLRGFRYEDFDLRGRLDTDGAGLLTINPFLGSPLLVRRDSSTEGTGFAVDVGGAAVLGPWQIGLGVNGIANRINWTGVEHTDYLQLNLTGGGDFIESPTVPAPDVRVELPVDVRANLAYSTDAFTAVAEFGDGYNGRTFRGGYEQNLDRIALRIGGRYIHERFEPTFGAGLNFTGRTGLDVALFGTSANLERKRHLGIAVSLRLTRDTQNAQP
jgi:hypothetical protein